MKIDWSTYLEKDTVITVNDKIGKTVGAETLKDQFGSPIVVHTILLTHKIKYNNILDRFTFIPLKRIKEKQVNYSCINVVGTKTKEAYLNKINES